jgi:hypothetical protein
MLGSSLVVKVGPFDGKTVGSKLGNIDGTLEGNLVG